MLRFDHSRFVIPDFEAREPEVGDISELERAENVFRAFASQAPAGLNGRLVTPARLCWVVLWSRTTNLGIAVASALAQDDHYTVEILSRPLDELHLHMKAIITSPEPVETQSKEYWEGVTDRLHAFLAWCLKSDRDFFEKAGSRTFMDLIWDPKPVADIVKDDKRAALHDFLGTKFEILNTHEIEAERTKSEIAMREKVGEIKALLRDNRLKKWVSRLQQLQKDGKGRQSFYTLVTQKHASISAEFGAIGVQLANLNYSASSALLHGQTALQFIECGGDSVLAAIGTFDRDQQQAKAQNMFSSCSGTLAVLHLIKDKCLE